MKTIEIRVTDEIYQKVASRASRWAKEPSGNAVGIESESLLVRGLIAEENTDRLLAESKVTQNAA